MATTELGFEHRFVPAKGSDRPQTLLLLHGTGGNEDDLLPLGQMLAPGAAILSPRGKVLERGMPRFFERLAEGVFNLVDLEKRTHELAKFVRDAQAAYALPAAGLIAVGYSNGANIASSLMLRHPGILRGGILMRAMVPFEPEAAVDLTGTSVLLLSGRADPIAPPEQAERLATLLRGGGASVELEWTPGGHELSNADVTAARSWLARIA